MRISASSDLRDFADVWPDLAAMRGGGIAFTGFPFQARDYLEGWLATMGAERRTRPFFVRVDGDNGKPWLLAPLGIEERRGVKLLGFLDGGVVDYAAPIIFPANALGPVGAAQMWRDIFATLPAFDVVNIEKHAQQVLGVANPLFTAESGVGSPNGYCVALGGIWSEFAQTRLPRFQTLRRKRRRLAEQGEVRFVVAANAAERSNILSAMITQKTRKYMETRGADGFDRPGYRAYFAALTERFAPLGFVHLSALMVNEAIVATHWGLVSGRRFYYLMPATEGGEWGKFSPGNLLTQDLIQWCYENGIDTFDFGVGDEPYKHEFAPETQVLSRMVSGHSLLGKVLTPAWRGARYLGRRVRPASNVSEDSGAG